MKIGILGVGGAGSVFAGYLRRSGEDEIWLIDLYREHLEKIAGEGLVFTDPNGIERLNGFHIALSAEEVGPCDLLVLVVKSTQTDSAMQGAAPCITENTCVISLQNGLGNELALEKYVDPSRIGYGCGRIGTQLDGPGRCIARPAQGIPNLFIGPYVASERNRAACMHLVECFRKGGLQPEYHEDVRPYIWKKSAANSGFNTVCAVLGLDFNHTYNDPNGCALVQGVFREASAVASAMGVAEDLYEHLISDVPNTLRSYGDYYPSMAQDILMHQRQTEVDTMTGAISAYGDRVGVETPVCDVLSNIVRAIQANYSAGYHYAAHSDAENR